MKLMEGSRKLDEVGRRWNHLRHARCLRRSSCCYCALEAEQTGQGVVAGMYASRACGRSEQRRCLREGEVSGGGDRRRLGFQS
jgi:hypothetical protein